MVADVSQAQEVTVTALADRHANLHGRDFATAYRLNVTAGPLADVLHEVSSAVMALPIGRYSLQVGEPFDRELGSTTEESNGT